MAAESGSSLIGLLLDKTLPGIKDRMKKQQDTLNHDHAGEQGKTLVACRSAGEALGKVTHEEARGITTGIRAIGQKGADAAKGHHGAVSDPEKSALAVVSSSRHQSGREPLYPGREIWCGEQEPEIFLLLYPFLLRCRPIRSMHSYIASEHHV